MSNSRKVMEAYPSEESLKLAKEFINEPDTRAQVKVDLTACGLPLMADMIDEAVVMARELIRLAAALKKGKR